MLGGDNDGGCWYAASVLYAHPRKATETRGTVARAIAQQLGPGCIWHWALEALASHETHLGTGADHQTEYDKALMAVYTQSATLESGIDVDSIRRFWASVILRAHAGGGAWLGLNVPEAAIQWAHSLIANIGRLPYTEPDEPGEEDEPEPSEDEDEAPKKRRRAKKDPTYKAPRPSKRPPRGASANKKRGRGAIRCMLRSALKLPFLAHLATPAPWLQEPRPRAPAQAGDCLLPTALVRERPLARAPPTWRFQRPSCSSRCP